MSSSADRYEIKPMYSEDVDEMLGVFIETMKTEPIWIAQSSGVEYVEHFSWLKNWLFGARLQMPSYIWFKAVEKDTGKIVGWTSMRLAVPDDPIENSLKKDSDNGLKNLPKGWNVPLMQFFQRELWSMPAKNGYDQEREFIRAGLYVHPEHYRKGIAGMLSSRLNQIADEQQKTTWVRARPKITNMFVKEGWEKVDQREVDFRSMGVGMESDITTCLKRKPKPVAE